MISSKKNLSPTSHSIFDFLYSMRNPPFSQTVNSSILNLYSYFIGYDSGLAYGGFYMARSSEFGGHFDVWICEKLNFEDPLSGWTNMILERCNHDEKMAFHKFYELLDEYCEEIIQKPRVGSGTDVVSKKMEQLLSIEPFDRAKMERLRNERRTNKIPLD